jgi:hypothetical protein
MIWNDSAKKSVRIETRVARWFIFQTINPNLGKFWKALDWQMFMYFAAIWNIYGFLEYFMSIWYIFPVLVSCTMRNLATLIETETLDEKPFFRRNRKRFEPNQRDSLIEKEKDAKTVRLPTFHRSNICQPTVRAKI